MTSKRKKRRVGSNGRNEGGGQFMPVPYHTARSEAFRALSGGALKVFIEIRCRFNGGNNGRLTLSMDEAARLLGMSKSTVQRAFSELVEKGFLKLRRPGQWYGRRAAEYIATDVSFDGYAPTRDWQRWKPSNKSSVSRRNREADFVPDEYREPEFVSHEHTLQPVLRVVHGSK